MVSGLALPTPQFPRDFTQQRYPGRRGRPRRHERLLVQGMEGALLSGEAAGQGLPSLLRGAPSHVEINNTFYRMPTESSSMVGRARCRTRSRSRSKRRSGSPISRSWPTPPRRPRRSSASCPRSDRVSVLFFSSCRRFCARTRRSFGLPRRRAEGTALAFEFRHASWSDEEVWETLRSHGAALCVAEGESLASPLVATADWGYVRLRKDEYPEGLLDDWAKKIRGSALERGLRLPEARRRQRTRGRAAAHRTTGLMPVAEFL